MHIKAFKEKLALAIDKWFWVIRYIQVYDVIYSSCTSKKLDKAILHITKPIYALLCGF